MATGLEQYAKKEQLNIPSNIMAEVSVMVPPLYYWEDIVDGKSYQMTMAFDWKGFKFGMSFPIQEAEQNNAVKMDFLRKKLFKAVKEPLDVLCHHGSKVLGSDGNIDIRLVNEQEAIRFKFDRYWREKVAALNKLVKIKSITKKKAIKLGFIDGPKIF